MSDQAPDSSTSASNPKTLSFAMLAGRMTMVDWRWATEKGFWDPVNQCWDETKGGKEAYIRQRNARHSKRLMRKPRLVKKAPAGDKKLFLPNIPSILHIHWADKALVKCERTTSEAGEAAPVLFDGECPSLAYMISKGWRHVVFRRYWNFGFSKHHFAQIMDWLPENLKHSIECALDQLESCAQSNASSIRMINNVLGLVSNEQHNAAETPFELQGGQENLWEEERRLGIIEVAYDAETQRRKLVEANSCAAFMMNMSKEEMMSRFASYELPLQVSELDALRIFCVDVLCTFQDCTSHYYRRIIQAGEGKEVIALLICSTQQKIFTPSGTVRKVRRCDRAVSVREYNEALCNNPQCCPLYIMGDRRSGQQLIDDADFDFANSIQRIAATGAGRSLLDELSARLEVLSKEFDDKFKGADAAVGPQSSPQAGLNYLYVHRPLQYNINSLRFHNENQAAGLLTRQWANQAAKRLWNIGHRANFLIRVFNAIPPRLVSAIGKVCEMLHMAKLQSLQAKAALHGPDQNQPEGATDQAATRQTAEEEAIWDEDDSTGFLRIDWDTATQCRKCVTMNTRMARLCGMHKEEMLARFANHELHDFDAELDFLCYFLFKLCTELQDETCQYQRLYVKSDDHAQAVLMCLTTRKNFNHLGQVTQGKHMFRLISPEEYDYALQHTPWLCPLTLMGDYRSGYQLLADGAVDLHCSIGALAASRQGRAALDQLAFNVEGAIVGLASEWPSTNL